MWGSRSTWDFKGERGHGRGSRCEGWGAAGITAPSLGHGVGRGAAAGPPQHPGQGGCAAEDAAGHPCQEGWERAPVQSHLSPPPRALLAQTALRLNGKQGGGRDSAPAPGCPHTPYAGAGLGPPLNCNSVPKTQFLRRLQLREGLPSAPRSLSGRGGVCVCVRGTGALRIDFSSNAFSNLPSAATHGNPRALLRGNAHAGEKEPRRPRTPLFLRSPPPPPARFPPAAASRPGAGSDARGCGRAATGSRGGPGPTSAAAAARWCWEPAAPARSPPTPARSSRPRHGAPPPPLTQSPPTPTPSPQPRHGAPGPHTEPWASVQSPPNTNTEPPSTGTELLAPIRSPENWYGAPQHRHGAPGPNTELPPPAQSPPNTSTEA